MKSRLEVEKKINSKTIYYNIQWLFILISTDTYIYFLESSIYIPSFLVPFIIAYDLVCDFTQFDPTYKIESIEHFFIILPKTQLFWSIKDL